MSRLTIFLLLISFAGVSQHISPKRGLAYGSLTPNDLKVVTDGVSWWYNWYHQPEAPVAEVFGQYDLDFVPMAWNGSFNKEAMKAFLTTYPNVKYLLGWNEPNFVQQANMTPTQAADKWKDLEEVADEFNLKLVGPAVNYCDICVSENGVTYTDPVAYLDAFFAACQDCRVDYIAIHSYMGNVSALQWYVGLFKKYGKPIWLTEFANWENNPTLEQQKGYMIGAVDYLENDPDVFRYAWFRGRHQGAPYIGVLETLQDGVLSSLGEIYVNMPLHDPEHITDIPARIEAEHYNTMSGIFLEATSDVSGLANVGYIDQGDWLDYGINVPESGDYTLNIRYASTSVSSIEILIGDVILTTIPVPNNGGWQTWKTISVPISLTEGNHTIKLLAKSGGFNLNWIEFTSSTVVANETVESSLITLYPNPVGNLLKIESAIPLERIELIDMIGKIIISKRVTDDIDLSSLSAGAYVVRITSRDGSIHYRKMFHEK